MLDVGRICSDDIAKNMDMDGSGGRIFKEVSIPITKIIEIFGPTGSKISLADFTSTPELQPQNEDQ